VLRVQQCRLRRRRQLLQLQRPQAAGLLASAVPLLLAALPLPQQHQQLLAAGRCGRR
jgi:hypothetical protein